MVPPRFPVSVIVVLPCRYLAEATRIIDSLLLYAIHRCARIICDGHVLQFGNLSACVRSGPGLRTVVPSVDQAHTAHGMYYYPMVDSRACAQLWPRISGQTT